MIKDSLEKIGQKYQGFIEWWKDYVKVLILSYTRIARDNVSILASGMVYSTLISIVPCIAFLFAFFSAFGVRQKISFRFGKPAGQKPGGGFLLKGKALIGLLFLQGLFFQEIIIIVEFFKKIKLARRLRPAGKQSKRVVDAVLFLAFGRR